MEQKLVDRPIYQETSYPIKKELKENSQGWTTKQVEELIIKKSGVKYHYTHIYRLILRKWGLKQKVPRKVHVNTSSKDEKKRFSKKGRPDICRQGAAARTRKFYHNIYRRIIFLL
jgi:hypothetical protein